MWGRYNLTRSIYILLFIYLHSALNIWVSRRENRIRHQLDPHPSNTSTNKKLVKGNQRNEDITLRKTNMTIQNHPAPRMPVTNEGLCWDSLLKMEESWWSLLLVGGYFQEICFKWLVAFFNLVPLQGTFANFQGCLTVDDLPTINFQVLCYVSFKAGMICSQNTTISIQLQTWTFNAI